jgi:hypothetical protein
MSDDANTTRPVFILRLRPEVHVGDPTRALRRALKLLLKRCGLRAIDVREEAE